MEKIDISPKIKQIFDEISKYKFVQLFEDIPDDPDYLTIIKNPITILNIKEKVESNSYKSIDEFKNDFILLRLNIKTFNGENSRDFATIEIICIILFDLIQKVCQDSEDISKNKNLLEGFTPNIDFAPQEQLQQICELLKNQEIFLEDVRKLYRCSDQYFKKKVIENSIEYPKLKACKKPNKISENDIEFVSKVHKTWKVGYQIMCHYLEMSEWNTRKIYDILFSVNDDEKIKDKIHTKRFYSTEINYVWHTDIHYLKNKPPFENDTKYLISFIDDCSRKILYYEIGDKKDQLFFVNALLKCINLTRSKPFYLTTDNGGEFTGALSNYILQLLSIKQWKTKPYTPQQNGKIERFWRRIEQLVNYHDLQNFVKSYNDMIPQKFLKKFSEKHLGLYEPLNKMTPNFIYQKAKKFDQYHPGIIVEYDTKQKS